MKPLTPATPHVIVMVGIPGSGKTTFAERFAKTFQAPVVHHGLIAAATGHADAAAEIADLMLDELFKTNRTIIYDGPTDTKASRMELARRVQAAGYQPFFIWVQTESTEAMRRASKRRKGGEPMSEADFQAAIRRFHPPQGNEKIIVISGKHTYASQLKIVLKHLAGHQRPDGEGDGEHRSRPSRNIILR